MKISSFTQSPASSSLPKPVFQQKIPRSRIMRIRIRRRSSAPVTSRKLGAGMWHFTAGGGSRLLPRRLIRELNFQPHNLTTEGSTTCNPNYSKSSTKNARKNHLQEDLAQVRIKELEASRRSLKTKVLYLMLKLYEERNSCTSTKPMKMHILIHDLKQELAKEKRNSDKMRMLNFKLLESVAEITSTAKEFMLDLAKECKMRILLEEKCRELSKKVEECKAEVEKIKRGHLKIQDEIEEEREMMQMADIWREEQVQIKLLDAKMVLEEKYRQMNNLVADLETFLSSKDVNVGMIEMSEAEVIKEAAKSLRINHESTSDSTSLPLETHKKKVEKIATKKPKNNVSTLYKMWKASHGKDNKFVNNPHIIRGMQGYTEWPRGIGKMEKL